MNVPYFDNIRHEIIVSLNNAKSNVVVAMAWFTNDDIFETLLFCLKRKVTVDLILMDDVINHADFGVDFNRFIESGGKLYLYPKDFKMMHNKFCIIDDRMTITGSYNWTNYAESRNLENIIICDDTSIAQRYIEYFNNILHDIKECRHFDIINMNDIDSNIFVLRYQDFSQEIYSLPQNEQTVSVFEAKKQECKLYVPDLMQKIAPQKKGPQTTINIIEDHQCPISKYNIGFKAYLKEKSDVGLKLLIPKGTKLPFTISRDAWNNKDNTSTMECEFYYGESEILSSCKQFAKLELNDLPLMKNGELRFKTNITFDTNGYIRVEFLCINTGKGEDATCINKEFVEYKKQ